MVQVVSSTFASLPICTGRKERLQRHIAIVGGMNARLFAFREARDLTRSTASSTSDAGHVGAAARAPTYAKRRRTTNTDTADGIPSFKLPYLIA